MFMDGNEMDTRRTHILRKKEKIWTAIVCLVLSISVIDPMIVFAEETDQEQKTVRVGYVNVASYEEGGEGEYKRGSGYEYLQKISYVTGWKYEYVYGSFKECYDMLVNGDIDLFGNVTYSPERAELMDFSSYPQGKDTYLLYTVRDNVELTTGDVSKLNHCKIGVTEGSYQEGLLHDWLMSNQIQAETIKYDGYETMMAALDEGELDAIATPDLATSYDYMPIVNIGFSDYYFAVNKSRPDLLKELNAALYEIQNSELDYNNLLVSRYHNQMSNNLLLSEKEKDWLTAHDNKLRIGYLADNLPYSRQSEDGEMLGVMKTLADTLENEFGITIETKCYETSMQLNDALEDGEVDTIGPVYSDFYLAEQKKYVLTNAFLSTTPVMIFKDHDSDSYSNVIAVTNESVFPEEVVHVLFPEAEIYLCDGMGECLDAVATGKADSTLVTSLRLNMLRKYHAMGELQFTDTQVKSEICLATTKANRVAAAILNKGISLSSDTLNGVVLAENSYVNKRVTFSDFVKDHMTAVFGTTGLIILVLGLMIYRMYMNEKKLSSALDEAHNANVAKTTFLSNMSHDIRTPMNAIIGFTNIARKHHVDDDVDKCLEKIVESSEHLLALINDVLDISRIEAGKVKFEPVPVNISKVTDAVIDIMQGFLSGRDLNFYVERKKLDYPYVLADPVRLREVLVNILSNAVKFTNDGGSVTFRTDYHKEDNDRKIIIHYSIIDTGIGMSKEYLGKIFEEFSQEDSGARTYYKGTGLGMPITKQYVELMGGTISVESEKGEGTTVSVDIPMELASPEKMQEQDVPDFKVDLTGIKVLLVEDNELNAEIAQVQLEEYGMQVTRVTDGKEAVEAFAGSQAGTYDLILMDIMMPRMNGYEATAEIRSMKNRMDAGSIPIIAMTANAFAEDVQASLDAGMNAHIAKPLVMEEVIKVISRNLI